MLVNISFGIKKKRINAGIEFVIVFNIRLKDQRILPEKPYS